MKMLPTDVAAKNTFSDIDTVLIIAFIAVA
jgi:hypothetical protein